MAENQVDKQVQYVVDEFKRYSDHWASRFEKASKIYDKWLGKAEKRSYDWQNAVHKPLMLEGEQTLTPRIFTALFPIEAPVDVQVEGSSDPQAGIVIKGGIGHYFKVANVQGHMYPAVGQATLFGTGYAETGSWLVKRQWLKNDKDKWNYVIVETRPDAKFVSFFEIFPNPDKLYMWDGLPLIRRRFVDAEYLKRLAEDKTHKFDNLAKALKTQCPITKDSVVYGADGKPLQVRKRDQYEVLEYWGPWDESYKDDKGEAKTRNARPYWIMVVNREVKIRDIANPYNHQIPPFIKLKLFEDLMPNWFGVGIGEIGYSSQQRVNKIINQRLDNVDLCLNKQGVYDGNDTLLNTKQLQVSKPGKWHRVQDVDRSMKPWDFGDVTASSYNEEKIASDDFRQATGATVPLQPGEKEQQHRTAMGIQLLQGAAGMRFKPIIRMMERDGVQQTAQFFYSNLHQFMTKPQWIQLTGESGAKHPQGFMLRPEHLQAKVHFIPTGMSETLSKELEVGQLLRWKEITMSDRTVNRVPINRRLGELMGIRDLDKMIIEQPSPDMGEGALDQEMQETIRQRIQEGASPEMIKNELLGPPQRQSITTGGG